VTPPATVQAKPRPPSLACARGTADRIGATRIGYSLWDMSQDAATARPTHVRHSLIAATIRPGRPMGRRVDSGEMRCMTHIRQPLRCARRAAACRPIAKDHITALMQVNSPPRQRESILSRPRLGPPNAPRPARRACHLSRSEITNLSRRAPGFWAAAAARPACDSTELARNRLAAINTLGPPRAARRRR
jgi:hypothetical protein